MESFLSRYKNVLVLLVVLLIQVLGLAVQVRRPPPGAAETGKIRAIRYGVVSLIAPPERWIHSLGRGLRWSWSNYAYLRGVRQQNRDLKAEVDRLRIEQAGLLDDARQGQRLQQLLSFREHYIYSTQPAQVIGTSGSDLSHVLYLDKGSRDGLKPDMPVITPDGIVGKIKDVFPHTSQLLVISDQTSGAGVVLETSRIRGVLRGNSLGQPEIVNIAPDEHIKAGERILTSGGDGVYPRGLPVGVVAGTIPDTEHDGYIAVVVKTAANLARLEEVLVVTGVSDRIPPVEQRDMARSAEAGVQKRAADILSERLPGLRDPNAPAAAASAAPVTPGGDPGRPPRPGVALHPDRFSPKTAQSTNSLTTPRAATSGAGAPVVKPTHPIGVATRPVGAKAVAAGSGVQGGAGNGAAGTKAGGVTSSGTTTSGGTRPANTRPGNTGPANPAPANTRPANTRPANPGPANPGTDAPHAGATPGVSRQPVKPPQPRVGTTLLPGKTGVPPGTAAVRKPATAPAGASAAQPKTQPKPPYATPSLESKQTQPKQAQPKQAQPKPFPPKLVPKPLQPRTTEASPAAPKPGQGKPAQAKPTQANPAPANPVQPKPLPQAVPADVPPPGGTP